MSVKKIIYRVLVGLFIVAFLATWIITGNGFDLIDFLIFKPIVNILFVIFNLVHDFGLAIIIFTVLVKLLMWPLMKRQLNQTKLVRKLQPELTQIKKNCQGNKQLESLQTMDLYKRYNVKPFASIATLFIQLPIFIAIFTAIRVVATPDLTNNLASQAYAVVAYEGSEVKNLEEEQAIFLADQANDEIPAEEKHEYDFHPKLFNTIRLDVRASDVFGNFSWSALFILICAILASVVQYIATKQQMPSGKSEKKKSFRELLKDAQEGKELETSDVNSFTSGQMSKMMPIMMFLIMFRLNGALAFYYFLTNIVTVIQQKVILKKVDDEIDDMTDKAVLKELKNIQEAQVVENKKTGTKITRISAKDIKKKRR